MADFEAFVLTGGRSERMGRDKALLEIDGVPMARRVTDALGPYRVSGGWWDRERWGAEEWDVEIAGSGLFRLSRQNDHWFIEGCYDAELR